MSNLKTRKVDIENLRISSLDLELIVQALVKEYLTTERKVKELKEEYISFQEDKHISLEALSFLGYKCECLETREEDLYSLIINLKGGKEEIEKQRSSKYLLYR
ncbi:hypothetical protein ACSW8L_15525 (plasmid) [Clostridium perfringens]